MGTIYNISSYGYQRITGFSYSEANHFSVKKIVMEHTDGLHGAMSELMKRQKGLMMKNHHIICSEYLQLKVVHHNHSPNGSQSNLFLFEASYCLCMEGYYFINKCYDNANTF